MLRPLRTSVVASLLAFAPACTVGDATGVGPGGGDGSGDGSGGGGGGGGGQGDGSDAPDAAPPQSTALAVVPDLANLQLGQTATFDVLVTSENVSGPVALALEGAPESWQVSFNPPELVFDGSGTLNAVLEVTVPPNGDAGEVDVEVIATAEIGEQIQSIRVAVENVYEVAIPDGVGQNGNHNFPRDVTLRAGAVVRFANYDTLIGHTIHASGGDAFPHQNDQMARAPSPGAVGGTYEVVTTQSGVYDFYCHDHGPNTGIGIITVAP